MGKGVAQWGYSREEYRSPIWISHSLREQQAVVYSGPLAGGKGALPNDSKNK
jgi:hypothetical protein